MKDINAYQVWTAIVTPMHADGSVDYESFEKLLKAQDTAGNAITILGSTGESLNIDDDERKQILDFALELNLSVPLMVGVGGINLRTQLDWITYLNDLNVDCYLLVVPLYAKPGVHGQYGWFKALMDAANKPCMLYNVPGRTAKNLEIAAVEQLVGHDKLWAIKEASGSEAEFSKYAAISPDIRMMSGDDAMLPAFGKLGAAGVVSVASNVWPEATKEYAKQCAAGTFNDDAVWAPAIEALFSASNPIPVKALLHELGQIETSELRLPLSREDLADATQLKAAHEAIQAWHQAQA